jgi:hypothetical protein
MLDGDFIGAAVLDKPFEVNALATALNDLAPR